MSNTLILCLCLFLASQSFAQTQESSKNQDPVDTSQLTPPALDTIPQMEYFIQVASLSDAFRKFPNLRDLGDIYKIQHDSLNIYRYQLGTFDTEGEVKKYLLVVKNRGFKDAFIVSRRRYDLYSNPKE